MAARLREARERGTAGHLNLIGWTGDYADPDNFIGTFFQGDSPQFGFDNAALDKLLNKRREQEVNQAKRIRMYQQANGMIMQTCRASPMRIDAGTRLPEARAGLLHEPDRHRPVRDRLPGRTV